MALQERARSFLGSLGFIGGEEERSVQEEDTEDYLEESEDEETRPAWHKRLLGLFGFGREDEDDEEEDEIKPAPVAAVRPPRIVQRQPETRVPVRDNIIRDERITGRAQQTTRTTHRERVVDVRRIDECKKLIECLLQGETVLICLENMDPKDCGRIVDLLSGAAFALQGRMIKVAHLCYLLAPQSVEIIDEKERQGHGL